MKKLAKIIGRLSAMRKLAGSTVDAFVEGVNPLGIGSVDLGRNTPEDEYAPMQVATTLGGAVGGGLLVPGVFFGAGRLAELGKKNLGTMGVGGIGKEFLSGAARPFTGLRDAYSAWRDLSNVSSTGAALSGQQYDRLARVMAKHTSLADAQKAMNALGQARGTAQEFGKTWEPTFKTIGDRLKTEATGFADKYAPDILQNKMTPQQLAGAAKTQAGAVAKDIATTAQGPMIAARKQMASAVLPHLSKKLLAGGLVLGLPAALGAYTAYRQYRKGQQLRSEQRQRDAYMQQYGAAMAGR